MTEAKISDSEWRVMQVIWDHESATAADVIAALSPQTAWSHRTIRTLLARLVDKGILEATLDGHRNLYRARVSRAKCVRDEGGSFLDRVFGGDVAELLVHFVRRADISAEQVEQLKGLLEEKREQGN